MSRTQTLSNTRAQGRKKQTQKGPAASGGFLAGRRLNALLCFLLAGTTIALYSPVLGYPFVHWDDDVYVTANPHIRGGLSWDTIRWAFTSTEVGHWHPLTWFSHALDYQLFALNPSGHHLDTVLIHALNVTLLFLLLVWGTKRVGPSVLVAALFAVHPINVESVAWVAERKNVLSTLFFLLSIIAYRWYSRKPDWRRYLLVAALFAAALMSKSMVITLPFVLLLLDYWPLARSAAIPILLLEKIPLIFLSLTSALVTLMAQRAGEAVRGLHQFPVAVRIEYAIVSYGLYLWKMLWPAHLAALYPHPASWLPAWELALSTLVLVGVTALVVVYRNTGCLLVGWFWFLGTLIPVIGVVQVVGEGSIADRYAYIPSIGVLVMIVWGLDDLAEKKKVSTVWRVIPALCALTALSFVTHRQMKYWDSDYDLWSHTLAVTEENPFAHNALADALTNPDRITASSLGNLGTERMQMDEARWHRQEALRILRERAQQNPNVYLADVAMTLQSLGNLESHQNRMDEARQHYKEALDIYRQLAQRNPDRYLVAAVISNQLGILDGIQNRTDDQRLHYEEALRFYRQLAEQRFLNPRAYLGPLATTLYNLGNLDLRQNRIDEAGQHYEESLKIEYQLMQQDPTTYLPNVFRTLNSLGNVDQRQNRLDDARDHYEEAIKIHRQLEEEHSNKPVPNVATTLANLANVDRLQNRIEDSRAHYQEALTTFQKLLQDDSRYAADVARIETILQELNHSQAESVK